MAPAQRLCETQSTSRVSDDLSADARRMATGTWAHHGRSVLPSMCGLGRGAPTFCGRALGASRAFRRRRRQSESLPSRV